MGSCSSSWVLSLKQAVAHRFCRELGVAIRRLEELPEVEVKVKEDHQPLGLGEEGDFRWLSFCS